MGIYHVSHIHRSVALFLSAGLSLFLCRLPLPRACSQGLQGSAGLAPLWRHSPRPAARRQCRACTAAGLRPASVASVALQALAVPSSHRYITSVGLLALGECCLPSPGSAIHIRIWSLCIAHFFQIKLFIKTIIWTYRIESNKLTRV